MANVYLGTDDSRQANKLNYKSWNYKFSGNYELGDHLLTFGYELDDLDVFNLFIQHTETENRFDEECNAVQPQRLHRRLPRRPSGRYLLR